MKYLALALIAVSSLACSRQPLLQLTAPSDTRKWNDFIISSDEHLPALASTTGDDCVTQLKKISCLVDPVNFSEVSSKRRKCLNGVEQYHAAIEKVYADLPEQFKMMMCTLKVVYIEKDLEAIAYAGILLRDGASVGNYMGVRASVLEKEIAFEDVLSWKEQKLFGAKNASYEIDPTLPRLKYSGPKENAGVLKYVILHEMAHLFDFNNQATKWVCADSTCGNWALSKKSWGYKEFTASGVRKDSPLGKFRKKICFYWCKDQMNPANINDFYSSLMKSNHLTAYAATAAMEDFAETSAIYFYEKHYGGTFALHFNDEKVFDSSERLQSDALKPKREAISRFYDGKLIYNKFGR